MKYSVSIALAAVLTLTACGKDPKPEPVAQTAATAEPAPTVAAPMVEPAPATPAPVVAVPAPPSPTGAQESFATKAATAAIAADAIGGSPVTNVAEAWVRGNVAAKKYCEDNGIPFDSFYVKESPVETSGYFTMQFFGAPNGQGMYIGVRVFTDGRAEIVL